jgi:hypothetical protein
MGQLVGLVQAAYRYIKEDVVPTLEKAGHNMPDARGARGRTWTQGAVLGNGVMAKMAHMRTGRQCEMLSELRTAGGNKSLGGRRLPDTTLQDVAAVTEEESIDHLLSSTIKRLYRSKKLSPTGAVKIAGKAVHVVMYDGQETVKSATEREAPYSRRSYKVEVGKGEDKVSEKRDYWAVQVAHAVLASAETPIDIGQRVVAEGDENGAVIDLDDWCCRSYRWMSPGNVIKMADAKHSTTVFFDAQGEPYSGEQPGHFAMTTLKGTRKEIYKEVSRTLERRMSSESPAATGDWEGAGHGRMVKRELWLAPTNIAEGVSQDEAFNLDESYAIVDEERWGTIRLAVLVRQTTRYKSEEARKKAHRQLAKRRREKQSDSGRHEQVGDEDRHYRYFILNVRPEDITPLSVLRLVRMMWQVEVYHNRLVQHMSIKAGDWVQTGNGAAVVAGLAATALNMLLLFQSRRLREDSYRDVLSITQVMQVFMIVITAGSIAPLLAEKKQSVKKNLSEYFDELSDAEMVEKHFSGKELELIVLALKQLLGRLVGRAREWLNNLRLQWQKMAKGLKDRPIIAHN